jgi:hypothetical protein
LEIALIHLVPLPQGEVSRLEQLERVEFPSPTKEEKR